MGWKNHGVAVKHKVFNYDIYWEYLSLPNIYERENYTI